MTGLVLAASISGAGAIGAASRYLLDLIVTRNFPRIVPRGTMTINVIGSLILGLVSGLVTHHHLANVSNLVIGAGFCGGLTTASSAAFEAARLFHQGKSGPAVLTIVLGIGSSCLAGAIGLGIGLT
ncbi:MAG TPA: CrcB family protein [Acidimicrobiales bacterium]|nr:CrcB family protein [Acidimicrobiales bacterium]